MDKVVLWSKTVDGVVYDIVVNKVDAESFATGASTIEQAVTVTAHQAAPGSK